MSPALKEALGRLRDAADAVEAAALLDVPLPPVPAPAAPPLAHSLKAASKFYDHLRTTNVLGPVLTQQEVTGCEAILTACVGWPLSWTAYALATAYHETAGTMAPIREYGRGKGRKYGAEDPPGSGRTYYGRGYVQLTWLANYQKAEEELGAPLVENPDLALDPVIAANILRRGMDEGWFTGKSLNHYLPPLATRQQFANARRIINGTDKADLIAGYAVVFQEALRKGEWS